MTICGCRRDSALNTNPSVKIAIKAPNTLSRLFRSRNVFIFTDASLAIY